MTRAIRARVLWAALAVLLMAAALLRACAAPSPPIEDSGGTASIPKKGSPGVSAEQMAARWLAGQGGLMLRSGLVDRAPWALDAAVFLGGCGPIARDRIFELELALRGEAGRAQRLERDALAAGDFDRALLHARRAGRLTRLMEGRWRDCSD